MFAFRGIGFIFANVTPSLQDKYCYLGAGALVRVVLHQRGCLVVFFFYPGRDLMGPHTVLFISEED